MPASMALDLILPHQFSDQLAHQNLLVMKAARTNAFTRVCFRVDSDARTLAEGFAHFGERNLMNLSTREAIVRMERAEWDFNSRTMKPPAHSLDEVAERWAREIRRLSRESYSTPKSQVQREWRDREASGWVTPLDDSEYYEPEP